MNTPDALISAILMTEAFTITLYALYEAYRFVRDLISPEEDCPHPCYICDPAGLHDLLDASPPLLLSPPPGGTHENEA